MRNLLIALTGFLVGTAFIIGIAVAVPKMSSSTGNTATVQQVTQHMAAGMSGMSSAGTVSAASLATRRLTIQHVLKGCHVWSYGHRTGAMMLLRLRVGQKLSVLDQDVDAHQMLQFAGPRRLHLGGPMMTNHGMTLQFMKRGTYHLGTKTVDMPGMGSAMSVKTIGPDNKLRLTVTVA
jgi:hypothetical protein